MQMTWNCDPPRDSFVTQQGILFGELLDFEWLV